MKDPSSGSSLLQSQTSSEIPRGRKYKSRKERPCDFCRQRKSCCVLEAEPPCNLCKRYNRECTFTGTLRIQPGNTVRNKRKRSEKLEPAPPAEIETVVIPDKQTSTSFTSSSLDSIDSDRVILDTSPVDGDFDATSEFMSGNFYPLSEDLWHSLLGFRSSTISQQFVSHEEHGDHDLLEGVPVTQLSSSTSYGPKPLDVENDVRVEFFGQAAYFDPYLLRLYRTDSFGEFQTSRFCVRNMGTWAIPRMMHVMPPKAMDAKYEMMRQEIYNTIGSRGPRLINLFFLHVNPFFPVFSRSRFYYSVRQDFDKFEVGLLSSLLAISIDWWSFDPELNLRSHQRPSNQRLFEIAWASVCEEMHTPRYGIIQACLLLTQRRPEDPSSEESAYIWAIMGLCVSAAQTLGLNLDCTTWTLPLWEKRIRRRLWWALFVQEKWFSLSYGRPSHIGPSDFTSGLVTESDFMLFPDGDEYGPKNFCSMAQLTLFVDEVVDAFCRVPGATGPCKGFEELIVKAESIQMRLNEWYQNMPSCLSLDDTGDRQLNANGSLHLAYLTLRMIIYRCLLRPSALSAEHEMLSKGETEVRNNAIALCEEMLLFVERLKPVHFECFWYSWSRLNFATASSFFLFLMVTSRNPHDFMLMKKLCDRLRWTLRTTAKVFDRLGLALYILDLAYSAGFDKFDLSPNVKESVVNMGSGVTTAFSLSGKSNASNLSV